MHIYSLSRRDARLHAHLYDLLLYLHDPVKDYDAIAADYDAVNGRPIQMSNKLNYYIINYIRVIWLSDQIRLSAKVEERS